MGLGWRMSATISPRVRFCAAVGWKGQHFADGFAHLVGGRKADAGTLAHAAALEFEAQFEEEQLFKDEAAVGGCGRRPAAASSDVPSGGK